MTPPQTHRADSADRAECADRAAPELADAVACALAATDAEGRLRWTNAAARSLAGPPAAGATLQSWLRLVERPSAKDGRSTPLQARDAGGRALPLRATPRRLGDGWCWTLLDQRADATLRGELAAVREQLELVKEFGRLGVWERDLRSLRGHWDRAMFRFFGFEPGGGTPDFDLATQSVLAEDRERMKRSFRESLQRPGRYAEHYRVRGADGLVRRLHSQWVVRADAGGRPLRAIGIVSDDTEVWRLAATMDETMAQLQLAIQVADIGIWRHDLVTQRVTYNEVSWRALGLEPRPEGLSLDEVRRLIHPDDLPAVIASAEQVLATGQPSDFRARYRQSSAHGQPGGWRHVLTRRVVQRDELGRPIAFIGVGLDQTPQIEQSRRADELGRRLQIAADAAGVAIWSQDLDTRRGQWNAQMYELHGLAPQTPVPELDAWLATHVDRDDRDAIAQALGTLTSRRAGSVDVDFQLRRADGTTRRVAMRARIDHEALGSSLVGVMLDVTERHAVAAALRDARERAALAARAVGMGTWELDLKTRTAWWDEQMWQLRGLPPRPVPLGHEERLALVHPEDRPRMAALVDELREPRVADSLEFRVVLPDGSVRWLASRSTLVLDERGVPVRRIGVNWDITEARAAATASAEKEMAQRESQAKTTFLSRMSHELRTPLNAVLGFTQLLASDRSIAEPARRQLDHVRAAGEHLLALVNDVLDLSGIESGELRLQLAPVPLRQAVHEVFDQLAPAAAAAGVRLGAGALPQVVEADATRLRQVLLNLVSNAVKYNRRGGEVRLAARDEPPWVVVDVEDTGIGLDAQQLAHLFEPFNRLGREHGDTEGSGIGLAVVKATMARLGGSVAARSRPGEGSCFTLRLRAASAEPGVTDAASAEPARGAAAPRRGRLLYIEDNEVNALIVRELVARRRHLVLEVVATGLEGVAQAARTPPDLLLVDMQLPDIDGLEVLRRLRDGGARCPCIALSANALPEDIERALACGFDDYWTKPLDLRRVEAALDAFFGPAA